MSPFFSFFLVLAPSELTGGGADDAAPEASVKGEAPPSLFCPSPLVQQKQRQTSEAWVLYFYSLLSPRKDARPLISFLPLSPSCNKSKGRRAKPGCCTFTLSSPPARMQGSSSLFCPSPLGQQKQRQTSEAWVLYFCSPLSPRKDARLLISFLPLPPRATKAKADERSLGAVLFFPSPPAGI